MEYGIRGLSLPGVLEAGGQAAAILIADGAAGAKLQQANGALKAAKHIGPDGQTKTRSF